MTQPTMSLNHRALCMHALDARAYDCQSNLVACKSLEVRAYWEAELREILEAKAALDELFRPIRLQEASLEARLDRQVGKEEVCPKCGK